MEKTILDNLALLLDNQGKYEEAEPLYRETLEKQKQILGEDCRIPRNSRPLIFLIIIQIINNNNNTNNK